MRNRRRLKLWGLLVWIAALWLAPSLAIAADPLELAKRDWSVKAPDNLVSHPPSRESIAALLDELSQTEEVDTVQFADLHHSGTFSMVVEQGETRCGGSSVLIVDRTPSGFEIYITEQEGRNPALEAGRPLRPQDDELIEDINQDGHLEIVLDTVYIFHDCASLDTVFPVIYAWTGTGYSSFRNGFRKFYQRKLEELRSKLAKSDAEGNEENWRIEAAAIERLLGLRANAGLDHAIELSHSDDWTDRELAMQILSYIPTAESRSYLITLSHDHCRLVAAGASSALKPAPQNPDQTLDRQAVSFKDVESIAAQPQ